MENMKIYEKMECEVEELDDYTQEELGMYFSAVYSYTSYINLVVEYNGQKYAKRLRDYKFCRRVRRVRHYGYSSVDGQPIHRIGKGTMHVAIMSTELVDNKLKLKLKEEDGSVLEVAMEIK